MEPGNCISVVFWSVMDTVWDCIAVYVQVHEGGPVLLSVVFWLHGVWVSRVCFQPCILHVCFPVFVSCVPDCVYSAACVQSLVGKGQGRTGLTCMLFPFFLALSLLITHTCSLKYRLNPGSVFSLSVRECMFCITITYKMRSDSISLRCVYILKWWLDSKAAINHQEEMTWIQY